MPPSGLVLHVVVAGDVGGAERVVLDLAARASHVPGARPHAIALCTHNPQLRDFFSRSDLQVIHGPSFSESPVGYLRLSFGAKVVSFLTVAARMTNAAVLHLHTFAGHVVGARAARATGLPVLRTEHSRRVYDNWSCWPFSRWSLKRAAAVVAVSRHVADVAGRKAGGGVQVGVVYNGVALPVSALPLPSRSPPRLAIVARLEPRKGVDLALHALAQIAGVQLDVVGDGPQRPALESLAKQLGLTARVTFHGHKSDPSPFIEAARAVVVPSRTEGLSLVALEAMARARPVVARPIGGLLEVVEHGRTGWVADDESVSALAVAMHAAATSQDAEARGAAGRACVEKTFSLETMRAAYEELYSAL